MVWNWFLADVFHATLSYWQSFGILIFKTIFLDDRKNAALEYHSEIHRRRVMAMIEATLPEETRVQFAESFKEEDDSWHAIIAEAGPAVSQCFANTLALGIGWIVHTFAG